MTKNGSANYSLRPVRGMRWLIRIGFELICDQHLVEKPSDWVLSILIELS